MNHHHHPHIRSAEEIQNRLAAPRIGEEVPDLETILPPLGPIPSLRPQNLLLGLPVGAVFEDVLPGPPAALRQFPVP